MTQHEEAFPYGEAVRLAEKYGLLCRTFNAIDGVEACCPNCGHILTDSLAAMIVDVEQRVAQEIVTNLRKTVPTRVESEWAHGYMTAVLDVISGIRARLSACGKLVPIEGKEEGK